ncbi:MAG: GNAT family N-acetyltransferase, partial [Candidatus Omnitrophota bacterium]|nr:GNAT family N-acetyltransferase [Candidatus Omnitrophota bacterium]
GRRLRAVAIPQALPWDSDIYRMPMARMSVVTGDSETARQYRVTEAVLAPAVALCDDRGVRHLSVRIDHHEYGVAAALGALGFWFVDATVTLMRPVTAPLPRTPQGRNRQASASDIPALQRVAASALVLGRAYHDPGLSLAANRELNRRWIANNCRGRAAQVLVAVDSQGLRGFICCNIDDASKALLGFAIGIVDLMAVAPAHQGRGVGYELLGAALRWFVSRADVVEIRTQLDNRVGLALYQKAGFCILSNGLALPSGYTFHRWRKA